MTTRGVCSLTTTEGKKLEVFFKFLINNNIITVFLNEISLKIHDF